MVGGSGPPKIVREKMEEASRSFADMGELLIKSGAFAAGLMGAVLMPPMPRNLGTR